jgi:putative membrane protein
MRILKMPALAAALIASTALLPATALADSPYSFIRQAVIGDNSEMMLGRMADRYGRSDAVRSFGRTLVADHRQARYEAVRIARALGVDVGWESSGEALRERDRLQSMRGRDFDREFIRFMIDDHRQDIAEFRDEAREHHRLTSAMAYRQLPGLRKHLQMALDLDRGYGARYENVRARGRYEDRNRDYGRDYNDNDNRDSERYDNRDTNRGGSY